MQGNGGFAERRLSRFVRIILGQSKNCPDNLRNIVNELLGSPLMRLRIYTGAGEVHHRQHGRRRNHGQIPVDLLGKLFRIAYKSSTTTDLDNGIAVP